MADLTNKDKLLQQTRLKVFEQEEEMKKLHLMRDKLILERSHILQEMKKMEKEIEQMQATNDGQLRMIQS